MILLGLVIFIAGSLLCAFSHTIEWFIIGRAIQGAGAVGSTINALAADLTRPEQRSKTMAFIGIGVGASFLMAMIIGPLLNAIIHVPGLFALAAGLGCAGIVVLYRVIPNPPESNSEPTTTQRWQHALPVILKRELLQLDLSIFLLHAILTANFLVTPLLLAHMGLDTKQLGMVYIPVMLAAFALMFPMLGFAEREGRLKICLLGAVALFGVGQAYLTWFHGNLTQMIIGLILFFTAFVFLEANLPALVTRLAPKDYRGTASGVFSASQFFGIFVGGLVGGYLFGHFGAKTVLLTGVGATLVWLALMLPIRMPASQSEQ